jgi:hypothetical protein
MGGRPKKSMAVVGEQLQALPMARAIRLRSIQRRLVLKVLQHTDDCP